VEVKIIQILAGAVFGVLLAIVALLFALGEFSPAMPYETALPFVLASAVLGLCGGGYLGGRLYRARHPSSVPPITQTNHPD
jgi:hypothetical protein